MYKVFWILRFITLAVTVCLMIFQRVCEINENLSISVGFLTDDHDLLKIFFSGWLWNLIPSENERKFVYILYKKF